MSLKTFTAAYLECALWSSTDAAEDSGGEPLDANYDVDDIAADTRKEMESECEDFYAGNLFHWESAGMSDEQAGHDFWLTRNGHGAGFWDRGIGAAGETLTINAKPYGEYFLYVGGDGKLHA